MQGHEFHPWHKINHIHGYYKYVYQNSVLAIFKWLFYPLPCIQKWYCEFFLPEIMPLTSRQVSQEIRNLSLSVTKSQLWLLWSKDRLPRSARGKDSTLGMGMYWLEKWHFSKKTGLLQAPDFDTVARSWSDLICLESHWECIGRKPKVTALAFLVQKEFFCYGQCFRELWK